ncbi:4'-phosphopantetheinyl transferase family protein [Lysobacter koreensis]|uniref:4'-phosphopantetheinyl transferase family protein n=1 Tax=Lysobacter koreensis TaxID=266122 RepID=A0ABW2YJP4_9GAMM
MDLDAAFAAASRDVLSPRRITVALMEVGAWHPWRQDAHALLDAAETARVQRRRDPAQRDALALAYAWHRLLLARLLGLDPADVPLQRDARGCPRLAGDLAHTSLSHADGVVAVAMTTSGPVGVDIELATRAAVMAEIARCVCHRSESEHFAALMGPARATAFLALWVRKEAVLKAAGVGLEVAMETFAAPEHDALPLPGARSAVVQVRMLEAGPSCVAAVAGPAGVAVSCNWLRPPAARGVGGPAHWGRIADPLHLSAAEAA